MKPPQTPTNPNPNPNPNPNYFPKPSMDPQPKLSPNPNHLLQQSAMARFPSNIDAHLRPLGVYRPLIPNPNPNPSLNLNPNPTPTPNTNLSLNSGSIPPPNPNLNPQVVKINHAPPPIPPPIDAWRLQSEVKRPFDVPPRDTVPDDPFFTVRDRKVRISDKNAIYALCRSWVRNGYREETQLPPQYGDVVKSLPKPLPLPESSTSENKETDNETDVEDENADEFSAEELLQRHIKRAKRVRERLKEERMRRIKRYKSRLKLLLPQPIEQCRGDNGPL